MSILVVDDAEDIRMLVKSILEPGGYRDILLSDSAEEALKMLDSSDIKVDLILLDILMPGMNGIELCRKLKSTEDTKDIQVIMVTAKSEAEYLEDAFNAGAVDYIKKPIERVELLARVRSAMRLKKEIDASRSYEVELDKAQKEIETFHKKGANEK